MPSASGSDSIQLVGSMPDDVVSAARSNKLHTTLHGVGRSTEGAVEVSATAELRITDVSTSRRWTVRLGHVRSAPFAGQMPSHLHNAVAMLEETWSTSSASPPVESVSAAPLASSSPSSPPPPQSSRRAQGSAPLVGLSLDAMLADAAHRRFVEDVVDFLALAARSQDELNRFIFATCRRAAVHHAAYSPSDVRAVTGLLCERAATASGKLELTIAGYALVRLERYGSKEEQKRAANRAFPALYEDPVQHADIIQAMELYVDRDVVLAARSRGGGIMGGLGSSKRARSHSASGSDAEGSDADEDRRRGANQSSPVAAEVVMKTFTDMAECQVAWREGDLSGVMPLGLPDNITQALEQRSKSRAADFAKAQAEQKLPPLAIQSEAAMQSALPIYESMRHVAQTLQHALDEHNRVVDVARRWCARTGPSRWSTELQTDLQNWWDTQKACKAKLVPLLERVHREAYIMEREIRDYVNLRAMGIL